MLTTLPRFLRLDGHPTLEFLMIDNTSDCADLVRRLHSLLILSGFHQAIRPLMEKHNSHVPDVLKLDVVAAIQFQNSVNYLNFLLIDKTTLGRR